MLDEYGSATEELRSAYEELKTANEELHRLNDELSNANQDLNALNTRLESRSRDLQRVNAELAGVLSSVGIPMLLLDRQLRICRFTPLAGRLLHIDASDVNRPVAEAWLPPGVPEFEEICRAVLDTFVPQFRPIVFAKRSFSLVVRPYRMENNQVAGVLVALMENPSSVSPVIV